MPKDLDLNQTTALQQAYKQFSMESLRLEWVYQNLEARFKHIQQNVQDSHARLAGKLTELDFISRYLETILDHISQGIIFIDLNGSVTAYNAAAQQILNIPEKEFLFHSFTDFFEDDFFGFPLKESFVTKICPKMSFITWKRSDDRLFELEIESTFVTMKAADMPIDYREAPSSSIQGLLVLIRNVTEIRQLQTIVNRNDLLKELGEMAAHLAHEIRNPLGGIKGFASLLHHDLAERTELQQMAAYIMQGTDHLNRLVTAILQYSHPFQPHLEKVDLIHFVEEIKLFMLTDQTWKPEMRFIVSSRWNELNLLVDPQLFRSALLNLFVNAVQAMPNGGQLSVLIDKNDREVMIEIQDTGVGINNEDAKKIFSPFFTTKVSGTGLGLAEVQKVVQAHGGSIEVRSEVGKGSCFTIRIPIKTNV